MQKWNYLEDKAVKEKRGMWKDGRKSVETPAQYKKKEKSRI